MAIRLMTFSNVDRVVLEADAAAATLTMDEDVFRAFYDRTARALWAYLSRTTGDAQAADDLLQECYYRLLRAKVDFENEAHRRHYVFRIAANLARDRRRRPSREVPLTETLEESNHPADASLADAVTARRDVGRALGELRPRDRDLLWFAYAQGMTHAEIAASLGIKTGSVKLLLYRARARLVALLTRAPRGVQS
jgi:RNA polymerase sigma-70 factor (ECF subfamily)